MDFVFAPPRRVRSTPNDPRCCAFLVTKPGVLCNNAGKEEVNSLVYCKRHVKAAKTADEDTEKRVVDSLARFTDPSKALDDEDECAICQDGFGTVGDRIYLECGHAFHPKCVGAWFAKDKVSCPTCRTVSLRGKVDGDVGYKYLRALLVVASQLDATHSYTSVARTYVQQFKKEVLEKPTIEMKEAVLKREMEVNDEMVATFRRMNLL